MALDTHKNATIWLAEVLAKAPDPEVEHVQSLNQEEAGGLFEACGYADFVECIELCRILAWNEKSVRGKDLIIELVQIGAFTYKLHGDSDETVPLTPKSTNEKLDDIWQEALARLEQPSTRQLLSQQAILISLNSKEAVVQVAANPLCQER